MGVTWLLTLRGIPSWYYGTEIMMKNVRAPSDAEVRKDFPGGFAGDKENKFTPAGRSPKENDAFNYVKTLANYRKNTAALYSGRLTQYLPEDGVYVYFRYDNSKTIMIVTNSMDKEKIIGTTRFNERMGGFVTAKNVITNEIIGNLVELKIPGKTVWVLELMK